MMAPKALASLCLLLLTPVGSHPCAAQDSRDLLPVHVTNTTEAQRSELVSFGVPLSEAAGVLDPAALSIRDSSGAPVACQFRPLARWGAPRESAAAPLKWVLATVAADVPPRGRSDYRVVLGPARGPESLPSRIEVASSPDAIAGR